MSWPSLLSRTLDKKEKKHHVPLVDRTPTEPPPVLVAVVGPPKVGKTTLIKSLIKNFTRQKLSTVDGPVTLVSGTSEQARVCTTFLWRRVWLTVSNATCAVQLSRKRSLWRLKYQDQEKEFCVSAFFSGKKRRLTFVECVNDINCMIDLAKVADLASPCLSLPLRSVQEPKEGWITFSILSSGAPVGGCQFWFWDGNIWIPQYLSSARIPQDYGCSHTPWSFQTEQGASQN